MPRRSETLIELTPGAAKLFKKAFLKGQPSSKKRMLRIWNGSAAYEVEVGPCTRDYISFQSRGLYLAVPQNQRGVFADSIICWYPDEMRNANAWWIDNEDMWSGTNASDPIGVEVSIEKLRGLRPDWFGWQSLLDRFIGKFSIPDRQQWIRFLSRHTTFGDSRAAVVLSVEPLLVAAYTDEIHVAAVLKFPRSLVDQYDLAPGTRLLTINTYMGGNSVEVAADLPVPDDYSGTWVNYRPLIAEFLTDEMDVVEKRKRSISNEEYKRAARLGQEYLRYNRRHCRSGLPFQSGRGDPLVRLE